MAPEEAERRIKRRERNRKSAQRCRERKIEKKETLQKEINDINHKSRKYLDLAECILKAWKERLRFLEDKLPGHNFKSQLSVMEFEQLIEACSSRTNEQSETGDTCSPRSSVVDPTMMNAVKQEFELGQTLIGQNGPNNNNSNNSSNNSSINNNNNNSNNNFMSCGKVEQYYPASFTSDLLPPNVVNSGYDQYHHHHHPYTNDNGIGYIWARAISLTSSGRGVDSVCVVTVGGGREGKKITASSFFTQPQLHTHTTAYLNVDCYCIFIFHF